jgi:hypothetical protein
MDLGSADAILGVDGGRELRCGNPLHDRLAARALARAPDAHLRRDDERRDVLRVRLDGARLDAGLARDRIPLAPDVVQAMECGRKAVVQGRGDISCARLFIGQPFGNEPAWMSAST